MAIPAIIVVFAAAAAAVVDITRRNMKRVNADCTLSPAQNPVEINAESISAALTDKVRERDNRV